MTDVDIQDFVSRFAAAWAARDPEAFLALWHPDGILRSPLYDRPVAGKELGTPDRAGAPDRARSCLATARLDGARRRRDRRMAGHAHRGRPADRLARRRQVPPARRTDRRGDRLHGHRHAARGPGPGMARTADQADLGRPFCGIAGAARRARSRSRAKGSAIGELSWHDDAPWGRRRRQWVSVASAVSFRKKKQCVVAGEWCWAPCLGRSFLP